MHRLICLAALTFAVSEPRAEWVADTGPVSDEKRYAAGASFSEVGWPQAAELRDESSAAFLREPTS